MKRTNGLYKVVVARYPSLSLWVVADTIGDAYKKTRAFLDKTEERCNQPIDTIESYGTIDIL